MNILIKLMSVVALVLAPWFVRVHADEVETLGALWNGVVELVRTLLA